MSCDVTRRRFRPSCRYHKVTGHVERRKWCERENSRLRAKSSLPTAPLWSRPSKCSSIVLKRMTRCCRERFPMRLVSNGDGDEPRGWGERYDASGAPRHSGGHIGLASAGTISPRRLAFLVWGRENGGMGAHLGHAELAAKL